MADSGFTGRHRRLALLKAAVLAPMGVFLFPRDASPTDQVSPGDALAAIDALEGEVMERLGALESGVSSARGFAASLKRDHESHRHTREALRSRLGLGPRVPTGMADLALDLEGLRGALEKLTFAHAEALPTLADPPSVHVLASHMVDLSRHLTLVGLWIEAEERRG